MQFTPAGEDVPDERIHAIVHEECEPDKELECLGDKWSQVKQYLTVEIMQNNMPEIQTHLQGFASAADPQQSSDRIDELTQKSYSLLYDEGLWFLFDWVGEEMEGHDENYEVQKGFGELYEEMDNAINAFTEILSSLTVSIEQQYSQFGLEGGGWLVNIDAMIMASVPAADQPLLDQPVDMLEQFKSNLMSQGVTVTEEYYGTTEVQCADGRDLAAKGQCEKSK